MKNYYIAYPHAFHSFFFGLVLWRIRFGINVSVIQIANDRCGNITEFFLTVGKWYNIIVKTWKKCGEILKELVPSLQQDLVWKLAP